VSGTSIISEAAIGNELRDSEEKDRGRNASDALRISERAGKIL
jgi:hypothetical protein